jgi:hypothetical protein
MAAAMAGERLSWAPCIFLWKSQPLYDTRLTALIVISFPPKNVWLYVVLVLTGSQGFLAADDSPPRVEVLISVREQRLALIQDGLLVRKFPVSTSKFGLGDQFGSYKTPVGRLRVCGKLGENLPQGAVFKHRSFAGEVVSVNARGRDPIVTRILWLEGGEPGNKNARSRGIYIHGTPQERTLGKATSYGCVRMRSRDVVQVFDAVPVGTPVTIITKKLPRLAGLRGPVIKKPPRGPTSEPAPIVAEKSRRTSKLELFKLTSLFAKNRNQSGS